jgi:hypothetical protein
MTPQSDKRQFRRLDKKFVLRVAPKGERETISPDWTIVTSKNISAGGVYFTYDRALNHGTPLSFKIHFPEKTIDCKGTVYRTSPSPFQPLVNVAAKLEGLGHTDRDFIEQYRI